MQRATSGGRSSCFDAFRKWVQAVPQSHPPSISRIYVCSFRVYAYSAALEEVGDPPDVVDCYSETPHMLQLASKYMEENLQVWQTWRTPGGTTPDDGEGWYAKWMTRPL